MNKTNIILLSFSACFYACSNSSVADNNLNSITDNVTVAEGKEVAKDITSNLIGINTKSYKIALNYEKDYLTNAIITSDWKKGSDTINYSYNKTGKLNNFSTKHSKYSSLYKNGLITNIKEEGEWEKNTEFTYNDENRIATQSHVFRGKTLRTFEYKYNENGAPVKVISINVKGVKTEEITLEYDDKHNPFVNKGHLVNMTELMLGYPVGNYRHNVTKLTKKYLVTSSHTINGKPRQAGDIDVTEYSYSYNEHGFPTSITTKFQDRKATMTLSYLEE